jgi:hypothetical protein
MIPVSPASGPHPPLAPRARFDRDRERMERGGDRNNNNMFGANGPASSGPNSNLNGLRQPTGAGPRQPPISVRDSTHPDFANQSKPPPSGPSRRQSNSRFSDSVSMDIDRDDRRGTDQVPTAPRAPRAMSSNQSHPGPSYNREPPPHREPPPQLDLPPRDPAPYYGSDREVSPHSGRNGHSDTSGRAASRHSDESLTPGDSHLPLPLSRQVSPILTAEALQIDPERALQIDRDRQDAIRARIASLRTEVGP